MPKTLFIFDIDDTLTNSAAIHIKCFIESMNEIGVEEMDTNFGDYLHHTDSYVSKTIYEKMKWQTFTEAIKVQFEKYLSSKMAEEEIEEIEGASDFVTELQKRKTIGVCFATGSIRKPAIQKLKAIGIQYDERLLATSGTYYKRESIIKNAIKGAKEVYGVTEFERVISVGDGLWDLKAAENLEIEFIGIGDKNKEILLENGCEKHFSDFTGLTIGDFLS